MSLPYPRNAYAIAEARRNGMRPAGPLLVVAHGSFDFDNATVYVDTAVSYRWDWVKGLPSIVVLIGKETRFGSLLREIEDAGPVQIDVIDHESRLGWMVTTTRPKLRAVRWKPFQVDDWLGDQTWHLQQARLLASYGHQTA